MQIRDQGFTVGEYCQQMQAGSIVVNKEYQRSPRVWPESSQSYLIDTILHGYPIPKLTLAQRTDLKSRKTVKEIVDGQQRSMAILSFFTDKLRLTVKSVYKGRRFSELDDELQSRFLGAQLNTDVFVEATEEEIRQMFRRINSYTVPLNYEEQRHATHQGAFKWFILGMSEQSASLLKDIGTFTQRQLIRMQDTKLFTEVILATEEGIKTYSKKSLDDIYRKYEPSYANEKATEESLIAALSWIAEARAIHRGPLMKPYNLYSLLLAIVHLQRPAELLLPDFAWESGQELNLDRAMENLSILQEALERGEEELPTQLSGFVKACSEATNTLKNRQTRFKWFCRALSEELLL